METGLRITFFPDRYIVEAERKVVRITKFEDISYIYPEEHFGAEILSKYLEWAAGDRV